MDKIYIFGHQNPDTDAVTSAITLSYLKNKQGLNTEPRVLGHISKETRYVLNYFNEPEPRYLNDVKLQLKDVEYHKGLFVNEKKSIIDVYNYLNEKSVTGTPIVGENNKYLGIITIKDIAKELINGNFELLDAYYENIINTLHGTPILKFDEKIKGNILVAAYKSTTIIENIDFDENSILIVGDRHSIIEKAVNSKVKLIIITGDSNIKKEHLDIAKENKINVIRTSKDTFHTSKLIGLSNSIITIMKEDKSKVFHENDYYDDFVESTKRLKHNNYPILNNNEECLGLIRITEIVKKNNKKVMLVDHQEKSQSVLGLDEASILEIVDHHKIGNINTASPINFRNMTVGASNTIIYNMYNEARVDIPKNIAGLMLSGILSDTLCLKSPTTTQMDIEVVEKLSQILQIDYEEYALDMFRAGSSIDGLTKEQVIKNDFKIFPYNDKKFAVGQIITLDVDKIFNELDEYKEKLEEIKNREGYEFIILAITDILKNGSYLLFTDSAKEILEKAYNIENINQIFYVDKLVSRKKQIIPLILDKIS